MTTKRNLLSSATLFLSGFASGVGVTEAVRSDPPPETVDVVDTASDCDEPPLTGRPLSYCREFPEKCNDPNPCPPIVVDAAGNTTGGCTPVEWVCCSPGLGCWAVNNPTDCGSASLFWSDCIEGEQGYDPVTGEAYLICHD